MLPPPRKRNNPGPYPMSYTKAPKMPKQRHDPTVDPPDDVALYELNDPMLGELTAKFSITKGQKWQDFGDPSWPTTPTFSWVQWDGDGPGIVYKIEERGEHVLVACFTWATDGQATDFVNELAPDTSTKAFQIVEAEAIGPVVEVYSWSELHRSYDNVGDKYFYRSRDSREKCSHQDCNDREVNNSSVYLVCAKDTCSQTFHGHCLTDQPLRYMDDSVCALGSPLICPACQTEFRRRSKPPTLESLPTFRVIVDIGTSRVKISGTDHNGKTSFANDSEKLVKPICSIDTKAGRVFFDHRAEQEDMIVVAPLKKLLCGALAEVARVQAAGFDVQAVVEQFFREVLQSIREEFQQTVPDLDAVSITLAVACPAGLDRDQQDLLLNAMRQSAKHVTPLLLNEAVMVSLAKDGARQLSKDAKILCADLGGYTADIMTGTMGAQLRPHSFLSSYCGSDWALAQLTQHILNLPENKYPETTIHTHVYQFWKDTIQGREPQPIILGGISFAEEWEAIKQLQLERVQAAVQKAILDMNDFSAMIVSGGGVRNKPFLDRVVETAKPALKSGVTALIIHPPASVTSTVLQGAYEAVNDMTHGINNLTVLLESRKIDDTLEYIVVQRKGEAIQDPVMSASRSLRTILYEVETGHNHTQTSTIRLLATSEDIAFAVSDSHYQVAKSLGWAETEELIQQKKMWLLGDLVIDLSSLNGRGPLPFAPFVFKCLVHAVRIEIHQGRRTAHVEAALLASLEVDPPVDSGVDSDDWTTWGFNESTSLSDIKKMSKDGDNFHAWTSIEPTMFSLDVYNIANHTTFED